MKEYKNRDITVYWRPELCTHARACVTILPEVFRPDARPWINLEAAETLKVILTIDRCPTGALRYSINPESSLPPAAAAGPGRERTPVEGSDEPVTGDAVTVTVVPGGPLLTQGDVRLVAPDGRLIDQSRRLALCRCGRSANRPYCDGAHAREEWDTANPDRPSGKD